MHWKVLSLKILHYCNFWHSEGFTVKNLYFIKHADILNACCYSPAQFLMSEGILTKYSQNSKAQESQLQKEIRLNVHFQFVQISWHYKVKNEFSYKKHF